MINKRKNGNTNIEVSELGFGCAPIGGWPVAVSDQDANLSLETAWIKGIRYFDTAPLYGSGMSEKRLGNFLQKQKREDFVISTKVGRLIVDTKKSKAVEKFIGSPQDKDSVFNFTYDGAMQSIEDSLKRLGLDKIDILYLHDPDNHPDHFEDAKKGAVKAMIQLRDEGVVKAIGCGMNQNEMLIDFAKEGCFDCFLLAGRYTLLDQTSLDHLIPICENNNIVNLLLDNLDKQSKRSLEILLQKVAKNFNFEKCAAFGNVIAGEVLKVYGPRVERSLKNVVMS